MLITQLYEIVEYIRTSLKRSICNKFINEENKLYVLRFDPKIENNIYKNLNISEDGTPIVTLKPDEMINLQKAIKDKVMEMFNDGYLPVILCQPPVRRAVWNICKYINRNIAVLSTREIISNIEIVLYGQIFLEEKVETK